jgi:DNA-binding LytR/AlgR family response regulator
MNFDFSKQKEKVLLIKEKTQTSILRYDEILYMECTGNLVSVFHTQNSSPISYTSSLISNETILGDFGFVRISDSKIVNMYHAKKLHSKKREIHMSNESILEVSRRKWHKIAKFFKL